MIISENTSTNNIIEDEINDINDNIKNKSNANYKSFDGELLIKNSNNINNHVKQRSTIPIIPHISSNQREQIAPNYSKKLLLDCYKPAILGTAYHNRYIITKGKQKSYIDIFRFEIK